MNLTTNAGSTAISMPRATRPRRTQVASAGLAVLGLLIGGQTQAADTAVVQWDNVALQAIRTTHPGPPIVARDLAILHTAMYDAWAAYDSTAIGTRLGESLRRPAVESTDANKQKAMSFAAYRALADLFPTEIASIDAQMTSLGYAGSDTSTDTSTPSGIGNVSAQVLIDFRHGDGSNQLGDLHAGAYSDYTSYVSVNTPDVIADPNHWQPLRVFDGHGGFVVQKYITPQWGNVAPFALTSPSQFRPGPPAFYGSQEYMKQAKQVLEYSANLTDRQKVIAEYWADGPRSELPPGHWALFAQFVSRRDNHTIDQDAKMFFAMTNAILDASIVAWEAKRFYDYIRPVSAIHFLFANQLVKAWGGEFQGTKLILGSDWRPYQAKTVVTPPFPEFFSGHSIFSAAGATVLKKFTGSSTFGASVTIPAGSSRVETGAVPAQDVTLSWATFRDAADEAGISRRYGGIHFIEGDITARHAGRKVGKQAWKKALSYFDPAHAHGEEEDADEDDY